MRHSGRYQLLEAITAPLSFFVLALLIVEAFLGTVFLGGRLGSEDQRLTVIFGVGMFVFVVFLVFLLVWHRPAHLTYDKDAHLREREKAAYAYAEEHASSLVLRGFWKPDGINVNAANETMLLEWLKQNELGTISITVFLQAGVFTHARLKAIREIGITPAYELLYAQR
jgi:hypothetical protein